jgi:hypothetical protein
MEPRSPVTVAAMCQRTLCWRRLIPGHYGWLERPANVSKRQTSDFPRWDLSRHAALAGVKS